MLSKEQFEKEYLIKNNNELNEYLVSNLVSLNSISTELGEIKNHEEVIISMSINGALEYIEKEKKTQRKIKKFRKNIISKLESIINEYQTEMQLSEYSINIEGGIYSLERIALLTKNVFKLKIERDSLFLKMKKISTEIIELWVDDLKEEVNCEYGKLVKLMSISDINKESPIKLIQKEYESLEKEMCLTQMDMCSIQWERLNYKDHQIDAFHSKTVGNNVKEITKIYKDEAERLTKLVNETFRNRNNRSPIKESIKTTSIVGSPLKNSKPIYINVSCSPQKTNQKLQKKQPQYISPISKKNGKPQKQPTLIVFQ